MIQLTGCKVGLQTSGFRLSSMTEKEERSGCSAANEDENSKGDPGFGAAT
jgi:hypothetical protein